MGLMDKFKNLFTEEIEEEVEEEPIKKNKIKKLKLQRMKNINFHSLMMKILVQWI